MFKNIAVVHHSISVSCEAIIKGIASVCAGIKIILLCMLIQPASEHLANPKPFNTHFRGRNLPVEGCMLRRITE